MKLFKYNPNLFLLTLIGLVVFLLLIFDNFVIVHLKTVDAKLIESSIALKFDITKSRLWIEETIADGKLFRYDNDAKIDVKNSFELLDSAKESVDVLLNEFNFTSPHFKRDFHKVQKSRLTKFSASLEAFTQLSENIIKKGSKEKRLAVEQKYDDLFVNLLNQADDILKGYQNNAILRIKFYENIHTILLVCLFLYILIISIIIGVFNKKRAHFFNKMILLNGDLEIEIENRKRNEKELKTTQQIAKLGSYKLNYRTKRLEISKQVQEVLGLYDCESNLKRWESLLHPTNREEILSYFKREVLAKHIPFNKEYQIIRENDGAIRWIHHFSKELIKDKEGYLSESIGIIQDITVRKKGEEALNESLQKFKSIVDNSHAGICIVDDKFHLTYVNTEFSKIIGFPKKELLNKDFRKLLTDENVNQLVANRYTKRLNGEKTPNHYELTLKQKDNSMPRYVDLHASVVIDSFNNKQMVTQILDITERKRSELTEKVLFNISNASNTNIKLENFCEFIKIELGKIINTENFFIALYNEKTNYISSAFMVDEEDEERDFPMGKSLTGYVIKRGTSVLAREKDLQALEQKGEIELIGSNSKVWLGTPLKVKDKVIGAIVVQSYTDEKTYQEKDIELLEFVAGHISVIIERKKDHENLITLTQAVEQNPSIVIITDEIERIEYVNESFENITGYTFKEVVGKNPKILGSRILNNEEHKAIWQTVESDNKWVGEFVNKKKNGDIFNVLASISKVKDENNNIKHYLIIEEDITEKKKLENQFLNAFIEAQETEKRAFGEELHDGISQILAAESMYINLLIQHKNIEEEQRLELLEKVKEFNLRAITDARSIAHGLMSRQLEKYGLIGAIEDMCDEFNETRNIKFKFKDDIITEDEIEKSVKLNLYRIVQEVTTNIVRHSLATKATVNLSKVDGSKLVLEISDNGIGIDFEKMKQKKKGAGIKNIERRVKLLNGTVSLNSEKKKGTQYIIEVPVAI